MVLILQPACRPDDFVIAGTLREHTGVVTGFATYRASGANGEIREIAVNSGQITTLGKEAATVQDWTPDGHSLLLIYRLVTRLALFTPLGDPKLRTISESLSGVRNVRFSPDGRYVTFLQTDAESTDLYIAAFPSFSVKRRLTTGGAGIRRFGTATARRFFTGRVMA